MKQKTYWHRISWHLAVALILALSLWLISPLPAAAQSPGEYFQISYEPVSFSQTEIHGSEVFHATILGRTTCTRDLPVSVKEAHITSRIIAEHTVTGARVILNSSYTVIIKPFPSKEGDITEINQAVPLKFPAQAASGDYKVIGELIEAKVKVVFAWGEVTEYLPQTQLMGSLEYIAPEPTPTVTSTPTPKPEPTPTLTPEPTPLTSAPKTTPPEYVIPWWAWLIVATAVATTMANIIWFLRRHTQQNRLNNT